MFAARREPDKAAKDALMNDRVTYEFIYCSQVPILRRGTDDWGLSGVPFAALIRAHRMLGSFLRTESKECDPTHYRGRGSELVMASRTLQGSICAVLPLEGGSTVASIVIAEVCAFLGCRLVPLDGGPEVAPNAEALVADVSRRAIARTRRAGESLCRAGTPADVAAGVNPGSA